MNTRRWLLLLHLLAMAAFVGSLVVRTAAGPWLAGTAPGDAASAAALLEHTTWAVTVPGLWIAAMAGATLALSGFGSFGDRWLQLKAVAALGMIGITHVVLVPASVAAVSAAHAGDAAGYARALHAGTVAASADLVLALAAAFAGVWKFGRRRR